LENNNRPLHNYASADSRGMVAVNIKVLGIGGAGNNAVNNMLLAKIQNVDFYAVNTDTQALSLSLADEEHRIQIGKNLTRGFGAGSDPKIGYDAAKESENEIKELLEGTDLLFLTAGMGGGTGTGATPFIAKLARELNILTIAVVTKPFETFEGRVRMQNALLGIEELRRYVDALLIIPNEKLNMINEPGLSLMDAFRSADEALRQGIQGITDIITRKSLINLDYADVKKIVQNSGTAHIGIGEGAGENRMRQALKQAVSSPLLETDIEGATSLIVFVRGLPNLSTYEINEALSLVKEVVSPDANIIVGFDFDSTLEGKTEVIITVIATGFNTDNSETYDIIPEKTKQDTQEPLFQSEKIEISDKEIPPFIKKLISTN
jgi:cell division protein FtsZ